MHQLSIVSINQVNKVNLNHFLSVREMDSYLKTSIEKKQKSFVAGRIAGKLACLKAIKNVNLMDLEIVNDSEGEFKGRPQLFYKQNVLGNISITHSKDLASATFDTEENIGIDLEFVCKRDIAFYKFNFTSKEKDIIGKFNSNDFDKVVTLYWTAKEAMSKAMGIGLRVDARSFEVNISFDLLKDYVESDREQIIFEGEYSNDVGAFQISSRRVVYNNSLYYLTTAIIINNEIGRKP